MESDRAKPRLVTEPNVHRLDAVRLLSLDAHGRVLDWMSWQDATCLYVRGAVAWTLGDPCLSVHGGTSRETGQQSILELHPIVAARSHARGHAIDPTPALSNTALFARDQHLCLYCGREFTRQQLTATTCCRFRAADATPGKTWLPRASTATRARAAAPRNRRRCRCWRCRSGPAGSST